MTLNNIIALSLSLEPGVWVLGLMEEGAKTKVAGETPLLNANES